MNQKQRFLPSFSFKLKIFFVLLSAGLLVGANFVSTVQAVAGITVDEMPLGTVVTLNGIAFIKISATNKFMAIEAFDNCNPETDMQCFDGCDDWVTPTAGTMNYSNANGLNAAAMTYLTDLRDGKQYEIRKFADGNCWMVNSLAYGGVTDACLNRTAFSGNGSAAPTNRFGTGTYGDCRNNTQEGYLYNWQAAMQNASAYYNVSYTGPTRNVQGICPQGWHLPIGGSTGEQVALDKAIGGTGANNQTSGNSFTFWRPGGNFKGVYSGFCDASGTLYYQGSFGYYWSSSQASVTFAYGVDVGTSTVNPQSSNGKSNGFSVRCVKN